MNITPDIQSQIINNTYIPSNPITLDECKEIVAIKRGFKEWLYLELDCNPAHYESYNSRLLITSLEEAAELYAEIKIQQKLCT